MICGQHGLPPVVLLVYKKMGTNYSDLFQEQTEYIKNRTESLEKLPQDRCHREVSDYLRFHILHGLKQQERFIKADILEKYHVLNENVKENQNFLKNFQSIAFDSLACGQIQNIMEQDRNSINKQ